MHIGDIVMPTNRLHAGRWRTASIFNLLMWIASAGTHTAAATTRRQTKTDPHRTVAGGGRGSQLPMSILTGSSVQIIRVQIGSTGER